jgi:hypothetical protein
MAWAMRRIFGHGVGDAKNIRTDRGCQEECPDRAWVMRRISGQGVRSKYSWQYTQLMFFLDGRRYSFVLKIICKIVVVYGLVVRDPDYRFRGPRFDSRPYHII